MRRMIAGAALALSLTGCAGIPSIRWPGVIESESYRRAIYFAGLCHEQLFHLGLGVPT